MTTTQDSLYFLSIVSFTNRAALCGEARRRSAPCSEGDGGGGKGRRLGERASGLLMA
jgi:hypothetical protein